MYDRADPTGAVPLSLQGESAASGESAARAPEMEQAETMVLMEQIEMTVPMTELLAKRLRTETMVLT